MKIRSIVILVFLCFWFFAAKAQGTLPIYTDYLSDNIYLVHPTAAGMSNCGKIRATFRQQWAGTDMAPSLQTLSFHNRISERAALGGVVFRDKNGFHSQTGIQASYAYHLNFGIDQEETLKQLSFALSGSFVQNSVDQTTFQIPDPIISRIVESDSYVNTDFSIAYFNYESYAYFTVKNLLLNTKNSTTTKFRAINNRNYILNIGHFFGYGKRFQIEPSVMLQYFDRNDNLTMDINAKFFKLLNEDKRLWFALSYRQNFDKESFEDYSQVSPIIGVEYKKFLFSYTYSHQFGDIIFRNGGNHQFTLGMNIFCKREKDRGYIPQYSPFMFKKSN